MWKGWKIMKETIYGKKIKKGSFGRLLRNLRKAAELSKKQIEKNNEAIKVTREDVEREFTI